MANFDYMSFSCDGSYPEQFCVHAKKFTREEAIEIFQRECADLIETLGLRIPTDDDILECFVAYRLGVYEFDGEGCYTFVNQGDCGSFPVWVFEFESLKCPEVEQACLTGSAPKLFLLEG